MKKFAYRKRSGRVKLINKKVLVDDFTTGASQNPNCPGKSEQNASLYHLRDLRREVERGWEVNHPTLIYLTSSKGGKGKDTGSDIIFPSSMRRMLDTMPSSECAIYRQVIWTWIKICSEIVFGCYTHEGKFTRLLIENACKLEINIPIYNAWLIQSYNFKEH